MLRDDNCCMLTGSKDLRENIDGTAFVEAVHIIPELINEEHDEVCVQYLRFIN